MRRVAMINIRDREKSELELGDAAILSPCDLAANGDGVVKRTSMR